MEQDFFYRGPVIRRRVLISGSFWKDTEINVGLFFFKVVPVWEMSFPDSVPAAACVHHAFMIIQK